MFCTAYTSCGVFFFFFHSLRTLSFYASRSLHDLIGLGVLLRVVCGLMNSQFILLLLLLCSLFIIYGRKVSQKRLKSFLLAKWHWLNFREQTHTHTQRTVPNIIIRRHLQDKSTNLADAKAILDILCALLNVFLLKTSAGVVQVAWYVRVNTQREICTQPQNTRKNSSTNFAMLNNIYSQQRKTILRKLDGWLNPMRNHLFDDVVLQPLNPLLSLSSDINGSCMSWTYINYLWYNQLNQPRKNNLCVQMKIEWNQFNSHVDYKGFITTERKKSQKINRIHQRNFFGCYRVNH